MIDAKAAGELADELEAKIAAMEKHATASDPLPQWSIAKDLLTHFMYVHRFDILAALRDDVARCEREEVEFLRTENDYLFQLLSPENKSAYLERLGISRERQDAAWKRVQDALAAHAATDAARAKAGEGER